MEGVTEGPVPLGFPGVAGEALPHGIFSLQRSIFIHFVGVVFLGGVVGFILFFLHFL